MTIAQQLKVTKFPFVIKNDAGNQIYWEESDGWWYKERLTIKDKKFILKIVTDGGVKESLMIKEM